MRIRFYSARPKGGPRANMFLGNAAINGRCFNGDVLRPVCRTSRILLLTVYSSDDLCRYLVGPRDNFELLPVGTKKRESSLGTPADRCQAVVP